MIQPKNLFQINRVATILIPISLKILDYILESFSYKLGQQRIQLSKFISTVRLYIPQPAVSHLGAS